jgi:hypothetical protein
MSNTSKTDANSSSEGSSWGSLAVKENGFIYGNNGRYDYSNGFSFHHGNSLGNFMMLSYYQYASDVTDALLLSVPILFLHESNRITFDAAWELANEQQKLTLIKLMNLK